MIGKAGEEGDGHGIVTAEQDRHGAKRQDLARLGFDAGAVGRIVVHDGRDVAGVDAADRLAVEQRAAEVEIPVADECGVVLAGGADGIGGKRIAAAVLAAIGGAVAGAVNNHARVPAISEAIGKAEEAERCGHVGLVSTAWGRYGCG
ncbi:hypothetical protein EDC40_102503 [Aminobacter aminovorans]|uniref:Uncharacterized protein n=1 Tax=Aminobacter aminovorans TaxID=83263 RepID=A0A380WJ32_AMIAI|nr:hypothetical protein EDC40_102503 [Aminobacter aminovorans]SUU88911.1 Uncharacterised protein [Aminobacter aminovorans]